MAKSNIRQALKRCPYKKLGDTCKEMREKGFRLIFVMPETTKIQTKNDVATSFPETVCCVFEKSTT